MEENMQEGANLGGFGGGHDNDLLFHHQALQRPVADRVFHSILHHRIAHDGGQRVVRSLRFRWQQIGHIFVIYGLCVRRTHEQQKGRRKYDAFKAKLQIDRDYKT